MAPLLSPRFSMGDCPRHFCFFWEDGMEQLESGERRFVHLRSIFSNIIHSYLCIQLFHTNLGMVSHHSEIKDCSFSIRHIEELVEFAIG